MPDNTHHADRSNVARPRAVFSIDDFRLLREAVAHYMRQTEVREGPDASKYGALYHRLGRLS